MNQIKEKLLWAKHLYKDQLHWQPVPPKAGSLSA